MEEQMKISTVDAGFRSIDELAVSAHRTAIDKGFWPEKNVSLQRSIDLDQVMSKLALMHSEISEILEALRKSKGVEKTTEEFADLVIRSMDVWAHLLEYGMVTSLDEAILNKMSINESRERMHGHVWG